MENIADLKPYLNLREGEEILYVNRYDDEYHIPVKDLYKYHEPKKIPKEFFTIENKNYVYHPVEIITNCRIILFGLNITYVKEDQITPISEAYHFENFIFWMNNEDIIDFDIDFGHNLSKAISVIFYIKGGIRDKKKNIHIYCLKYKKYLQVKDIAINLFKFKKEEIDQAEEKRISRVMSNNKEYYYWGFMILVALGLFGCNWVNPGEAIGLGQKMFSYSSIILYFAYVVFFLIFGKININNLRKTRKSGDFLKLMDVKVPYFIGSMWYKGPMIYLLAIVTVICIALIESLIYMFLQEELIWKITGFGIIVFGLILGLMFYYSDKKKEKKI